MKAYKYSSVFLMLLLSGFGAISQQRVLKLEASYKAAMPLGGFRNITDKISTRGWEAAVMYGVTDQFSVGLQTGFQDFYQKYGRTVIHEPGSDLSAVITNSVQLVPLLLKAKYSFTPPGTVQPFAALGAGAGLVQYGKYYGQFADSRSKIGFMAQPEIGVQALVGRAKRTGVHLAAAYNIVPFKENDANGFHHASVKAGISIPLR